jgi:predicted nucleic acid-binding Zn ribbon protein
VRLGDMLGVAMEKLGPRGVWLEARVRKAWAQAVGGPVAENARVKRLRGSTLEVAAGGDSWATELRYMSGVIAQKINEFLGQEIVREVVVVKDQKRR